jgi:hypothetical protein
MLQCREMLAHLNVILKVFVRVQKVNLCWNIVDYAYFEVNTEKFEMLCMCVVTVTSKPIVTQH